MSRPPAVLFVLAVLSPGCVPVTEPVGDIDKAEVDKNLVGSWISPEAPEAPLKIDVAPEVKGNPKGLLRMIPTNPKKKETLAFFYLATVGKNRYGNLLLEAVPDAEAPPDFGKEGVYEKWAKGPRRVYWVFLVEADKDGVTFNFGDGEAFNGIMAAAKIELLQWKAKSELPLFAFKTPAGWLTKYLEKNDCDKIFPAKTNQKLVKAKK